MADRWILETSIEAYELNPTFAAQTLHAGGVDTSAVQRNQAGSLTRAGDGLRTPGPLTLTGRVWRDDRDTQATVLELEQIQAAVTDCIRVVRRNTAGSFIYDSISGGPVPEVHADGLGGWRVVIELWPAEPEPTFLPLHLTPDTFFYAWIDSSGSINPAPIEAALEQLKAVLQVRLYRGVDVNTRVFVDPDWDDERWVGRLTATTTAAARAVALIFTNEAAPAYHSATYPSVEPTSTYNSDHTGFISAVFNREFRGTVFAIAIGGGSDVFQQHLVRALRGTDGYPTGLDDYGINAVLNIDPDSTAEQWLARLLQGLQVT